MRIYLNTSALSRPFDDLRVPRIRLEAEAVAALVAAVEAGDAELVSSGYLLFEVGQHPDPDRANRIGAPLELAKTVVKLSPRVVSRARELERFGLRGLDALHIACAEVGLVDLLVTTDDRMLRRARRAGAELAVRVVSPLDAMAALSRRQDNEE
jgi:predicted nucleic acid-binding protein